MHLKHRRAHLGLAVFRRAVELDFYHAGHGTIGESPGFCGRFRESQYVPPKRKPNYWSCCVVSSHHKQSKSVVMFPAKTPHDGSHCFIADLHAQDSASLTPLRYAHIIPPPTRAGMSFASSHSDALFREDTQRNDKCGVVDSTMLLMHIKRSHSIIGGPPNSVMIFLASQRLEMLKYLFFQKNIDLVILKPIQKSSYNHPLQKTSSKNHPRPPPSSLLHIASILCVSIFLSFPFLPVPSRSLPFSISLFLFPCSISFLFFLFLVLSNSLCPALFLLSLFTLPLPETDRKSKKLQNPHVFFKKSSNNHRTIFENHPQSTFSGPNPLHSRQESKKLQNPRFFFFFSLFFKKKKIIEKSSPTHIFWTNPPSQWSGKQQFAKPSCFFSKNHRKIIEKSSKNHRTIFEKSSPTQIFWTNPPSQWSGKQKVAKPSCFFSKNHRTIFEKSSKNLRKIILTGIHLQKIIQQIILPDINLPKIILPIFLPCSPAWNAI